jgi:dUTP pyrophosphatase
MGIDEIGVLAQHSSLMPSRSNNGDAGADLHASTSLILEAGESRLVPTGIQIKIPYGYVGLVHPRSGLALRHGITVLNAPGTVDHGYQGEVGVILYNTSEDPFEIKQGDRIAQLVIQKVELSTFVQLTEDEYYIGTDSERGTGGFGSTGVS